MVSLHESCRPAGWGGHCTCVSATLSGTCSPVCECAHCIHAGTDSAHIGCLEGMHSVAMCHCQQLTCVTFSDFRISRKAQKETVSLLQRKGESVTLLPHGGDLFTSCNPGDEHHVSGGRPGASAICPADPQPATRFSSSRSLFGASCGHSYFHLGAHF